MEVDVPANMKSVYGGSRQMMTYLSLSLFVLLCINLDWVSEDYYGCVITACM